MQSHPILKPTFHDVVTGPFWHRKWLTIVFSIILLGGTAAFMWAAFMSIPDAFGIPWGIGSCVLISCIQVYIVGAIWRTAYRRTLWQNYSIELGGTYSFDQRPTSPALVFNRGIDRQVTDQITGLTALPFTSLGNYSYYYYVEYQRSAIPLFPRKIAFLTLPLPRHLPHIVLDAKKNNFLGRYSEYNLELQGLQRLELEGDFINHFSLYVPRGYESDALYIFSPDVMSIIVQYATEYDIEIIDDTLYLFTPGRFDIRDSKTLSQLTTVGTVLLQKLDKNVARYADAMVGDYSVDEVSPRGSRLKIRTLPVIAILVIIYFVCLLYSNL